MSHNPDVVADRGISQQRGAGLMISYNPFRSREMLPAAGVALNTLTTDKRRIDDSTNGAEIFDDTVKCTGDYLLGHFKNVRDLVVDSLVYRSLAVSLYHPLKQAGPLPASH